MHLIISSTHLVRSDQSILSVASRKITTCLRAQEEAGSGLDSLGLVSFKKCWLCITTCVHVRWTDPVLWASNSRAQMHSLCTGLKELLFVSQTTVTVHVCFLNLFQFKLLSSSFQLNSIISHLGQTKSIHGKQLPRLPRLSWHVLICCAAATCSYARALHIGNSHNIRWKRRVVGENYLDLLTFYFWNSESSGSFFNKVEIFGVWIKTQVGLLSWCHWNTFSTWSLSLEV